MRSRRRRRPERCERLLEAIVLSLDPIDELAGAVDHVEDVVRQAIDMVVERIDAGCGADTGLAHRSAQALLPAPDLVDEIAAAGKHAADRRAQSL